MCSVFEGPERTTLSWAFFATCCSLQLQNLQRKWKVIPKLAQKLSQWFFGDSFGGSIGRPKKSKAVPFFGTGLPDDPGGPHGAGCSSTLRSKDRPQRNKHWKDVKQRFQTRRSKGFLTCHEKFFFCRFL